MLVALWHDRNVALPDDEREQGSAAGVEGLCRCCVELSW